MFLAKLLLGIGPLLHVVGVTVSLRYNLLDVALHEIFGWHILLPPHELALEIDERLGVGLMEHLEEDLRIG